MCELGAVMCLKWFKSEMWCAAKRVDWHLCLLKSITWTTKHRQRQTLHCKMQLCYFSILCALPLWSLSDVIKPEEKKQTRIFFDSTLKNLDKDGFFFFFFLVWYKTSPTEFSLLWHSMRIFTSENLHLKLCSYVYELEYKFRIN